jgi:hypothetical protein
VSSLVLSEMGTPQVDERVVVSWSPSSSVVLTQ